MAYVVYANNQSLVVPDAYVTTTVATTPAGLAQSGVVTIIGEADAGPSWDQDLLENQIKPSLNMFGPTDLKAVIAKYGSGPIVDGFKALLSPSLSPRVTGSPSRISIMKINQGVAASLTSPDSVAKFSARQKGEPGNQLQVSIAAQQSEVVPQTPKFTYVPYISDVAISSRVDGQSEPNTFTITANMSPAAFKASGFFGGQNVAVGGDALNPISNAISPDQIKLEVQAGMQVKVSLSVGKLFGHVPSVGDTMNIANTSAIVGAGNANVGWYVITSVVNATTGSYILATKSAGASPVTTAYINISGTPNNDLQCYSAMTIKHGNPAVPGLGKSMDITDGGGAAALSNAFKNLGTLVAASFIGTMMVSAQEQIQSVLVKKANGQSESYNVGGKILMSVGYNGSNANMTISGNTLAISVSGGTGSSVSLDLSKINSINDLCSKLTLAGIDAAPSNAQNGLKSPLLLDKVSSIQIISTIGGKPGRIKADANDLNSISSPSIIAQNLNNAGLPAAMSYRFLNNGAKGSSSNTSFASALDALQGVRTNFIIPLISRDASLDIVDGLTDLASTYEIDAVNALVRDHCVAMSTAKLSRHRIACVSKKDTYNNVKEASMNLASYRLSFLFQDIKSTDSSGNIKQFQPWYGACLAAGFQAAAGYKSIFNKNINIIGALQAAGDFDDENISSIEDAILANMIPIQRQETGGWNFVTDQTTYGLDSNVIYNSMQAVYVADLITLSLKQSLKNAFVGESVADVSEGLAVSFLKGKCQELLAAKWIVSSPQQKAPSGWTHINVAINGSLMTVDMGLIESTSLKIISVNLELNGINSSSTNQGA